MGELKQVDETRVASVIRHPDDRKRIVFMTARICGIPAYLLALMLTGCATVDFDYPKQASYARTETDDTYLGQVFAPLRDAHPEASGFYLLPDGIEALAARLLFAARAERTIDAQYYLINNDDIGIVFIGALLDAADRGIRVRLLVDDFLTKGYDAGIAALDSHPNFELRIFNPFATRNIRFLDGIRSFTRVNRRMHNKAFTVDNQITVIGSRNIAAEYFSARADRNFADLDTLAVGSIVHEVSQMFDRYWNSRKAAVAPSFMKLPPDPKGNLVRVRERIEQARARLIKTPYAESLAVTGNELLDKKATAFTWSPYELVYDAPEKAERAKAAHAQSILDPLRAAIGAANRELVIVTPYFVPQSRGIEFARGLRDRGVEVVIITNSLASTNQRLVHSGYAPARRPLLEMGVKLYEVRSDAGLGNSVLPGGQAAAGVLHTKAFLVDREKMFIGSFNFDPRSAWINTELGIIIDSPEISGAVAERIDDRLSAFTYEVVLTDDGKLRWLEDHSAGTRTLSTEPGTSFWERAYVNLLKLLPIKGQL